MLLANIKSGSVLVAQPKILGESFFERSVVLVAKHEKTGSVGFIINKPVHIHLSDVFAGINKDFEIFSGGPVDQDKLYFIHNCPDLVPNSIEISNGVYWGGDFEVVKKLIQDDVIDTSNVRFFLGYSGWETNQLVSEVSEDSWIVKDSIDQEIISSKHKDLWRTELRKLGGEFLLWINSPKDPSHN